MSRSAEKQFSLAGFEVFYKFLLATSVANLPTPSLLSLLSGEVFQQPIRAASRIVSWFRIVLQVHLLQRTIVRSLFPPSPEARQWNRPFQLCILDFAGTCARWRERILSRP